MSHLRVIYEDNHLLVVNKPSGLATMGVTADRPSMVRAASEYLKRKYRKPGRVYIGVVSRLDAPASGVLVLARTSKAASRLSEQIRQRRTGKRYLAVVEGGLEPTADFVAVEDCLAKNDSRHCMEIVGAAHPQAQPARLRWRCLFQLPRRSLLEIELDTGRKHQIRVQLAGMGHPICGDSKYGARHGWPSGIALHCFRYTLEHPTRHRPIQFQVLPDHWSGALGAAYQQLLRMVDGDHPQGTVESP